LATEAVEKWSDATEVELQRIEGGGSSGSGFERPSIMGDKVRRQSGGSRGKASPSRNMMGGGDGKKLMDSKSRKGDKVAVIPENFVRKMISVERMRVVYYKLCGMALAGGFSRWVDSVGKSVLNRVSSGRKVVEQWQNYAWKRRTEAHSRLYGKRYLVRTKAGAQAWWQVQTKLVRRCLTAIATSALNHDHDVNHDPDSDSNPNPTPNPDPDPDHTPRGRAATRKALLQLLTTRLVKGWLKVQNEQADITRRSPNHGIRSSFLNLV